MAPYSKTDHTASQVKHIKDDFLNRWTPDEMHNLLKESPEGKNTFLKLLGQAVGKYLLLSNTLMREEPRKWLIYNEDLAYSLRKFATEQAERAETDVEKNTILTTCMSIRFLLVSMACEVELKIKHDKFEKIYRENESELRALLDIRPIESIDGRRIYSLFGFRLDSYDDGYFESDFCECMRWMRLEEYAPIEVTGYLGTAMRLGEMRPSIPRS